MPWQWAADEYVWRQLANDLSARIAEGTYPLGSALPAEDELAREYAVARATVRRALAVLRRRKLIKNLHGQRNTVVAMPEPGGCRAEPVPESTGWRSDLKPSARAGRRFGNKPPRASRTRRQPQHLARVFCQAGRRT